MHFLNLDKPKGFHTLINQGVGPPPNPDQAQQELDWANAQDEKTIRADLEKHNANLTRIYRKYWRRGHSTSPEMDIAMSLIGSMSMYHMKRVQKRAIGVNPKSSQDYR